MYIEVAGCCPNLLSIGFQWNFHQSAMFSVTKIHVKMSSAKYFPFCSGLNMLLLMSVSRWCIWFCNIIIVERKPVTWQLWKLNLNNSLITQWLCHCCGIQVNYRWNDVWHINNGHITKTFRSAHTFIKWPKLPRSIVHHISSIHNDVWNLTLNKYETIM